MSGPRRCAAAIDTRRCCSPFSTTNRTPPLLDSCEPGRQCCRASGVSSRRCPLGGGTAAGRSFAASAVLSAIDCRRLLFLRSTRSRESSGLSRKPGGSGQVAHVGTAGTYAPHEVISGLRSRYFSRSVPEQDPAACGRNHSVAYAQSAVSANCCRRRPSASLQTTSGFLREPSAEREGGGPAGPPVPPP